LGKFNLTSLGGLVIATGVLYALVTFFGIHYLLANIVGIGAATAWNFVTSVIWTWGAEQ
jgi:putative flippase GtrA